MKRPFIVLTIIAIIVIALASVGPTIYQAFFSPGVKTGGLVADGARPANTGVDGKWKVIDGAGDNRTSVGYTFHEVLPNESRETSGTTRAASGTIEVADGKLAKGRVTVDLKQLSTDNEKRDVSVRDKLLETDRFPEAVFESTEHPSLAKLPEDGKVGKVHLVGKLTLKGVTKPAAGDFDVLRTGSHVVLAGNLPVNRKDFHIKTHDFIAAQIDEQGAINIRLTLAKDE